MPYFAKVLSLVCPVLVLAVFSARGAVPPLPAALPVQDLPSATADAGSTMPLVSSDGRWVVFTSLAGNLVTNDLNGATDVFVYNLDSGKIALVSSNYSGSGSGNARSMALGISTNGQWVLFESLASDIVPGDTNGMADLFVRNVTAGATLPVSVDMTGALVGNFRNASLSADGRVVVFETEAPGITTNTTVSTQVYLRDIENGIGALVSVSSNPATGGNGQSFNAVMTPDACRIVFQSYARNLTSNDANYSLDIYSRDVGAATSTLVSVNRYGSTGSGSTSINPSLSDDGRYVAFESTASNLGTNSPPLGATSLVYLRDMLAGATTFISSQTDNGSATRPVVSPDGRFVAYESATNIYCWDAETRAAYPLTTNYTGAGRANGLCHSPQFTAGSRYCFFMSSATNLTQTAGLNSEQFRVYRRDMVTGEVVLVSESAVGTVLDQGWASASDDGNIVAFERFGLEPGDYNEAPDIIVRDLFNRGTTLLSVPAAGLASATATGPSSVGPNCLSADGRYLLFSSSAMNLVGGGTSGLQNLFVRDLANASNRLVTASWDGRECGNGAHFGACISGDGRWVAYQSSATNLVAWSQNAFSDIFVRDLPNETNYQVTVPGDGVSAANNHSYSPALSHDGQVVVFQSLASNLGPPDSGTTLDAFARDMAQQTNIALSTRYDSGLCVGGQTYSGNGASNAFTPRLTPDGNWAIIWSTVNLVSDFSLRTTPYCFARDLQGHTVPIAIYTNGSGYSAGGSLRLAPGGRFAAYSAAPPTNMLGIYDFAAQTNYYAGRRGANPSLSADGRWLAFEAAAAAYSTNSGNTVSDIFLLDRQSNSVRLVSLSRNIAGGGNGASFIPLLSGDARYLVFGSKASDLVPTDTNGVTDIFVADLTTGSVLALSSAIQANTGNRVSGKPIIGPDGRTVVFESYSSDLSPGDFNEAKDVFVLRLPGDVAPEFRIFTLTSTVSGSVTIYWYSVPDKTYRVEYSASLSGPVWTAIPVDVVATGQSSSKADPQPAQGASRFYRVRLLQ